MSPLSSATCCHLSPLLGKVCWAGGKGGGRLSRLWPRNQKVEWHEIDWPTSKQINKILLGSAFAARMTTATRSRSTNTKTTTTRSQLRLLRLLLLPLLQRWPTMASGPNLDVQADELGIHRAACERPSLLSLSRPCPALPLPLPRLPVSILALVCAMARKMQGTRTRTRTPTHTHTYARARARSFSSCLSLFPSLHCPNWPGVIALCPRRRSLERAWWPRPREHSSAF